MMRLFHLAFILLPVFTSYAYAIEFKAIPLHAKHAEKVSGTIPFIQGKGYDAYNHTIKTEILNTFDQPNWWVSMQAQKIYQDQDYLSYEMNYEISDLTTRNKSFYYTIDLKTKNNITLSQYLKRHHLSAQKIQQKIIQFVQYCDQNIQDESCNDMTFSNVFWGIDDPRAIFDLSQNPNFYLKKHIIGINFEGSKYTYALEYNIQTHELH